MTRYNTPEGTIPLPVASVLCMIAIVAFANILPIAFEREERRQKIVQQHDCEQYGPSIARWAEDKGIKNPCDKTTNNQ